MCWIGILLLIICSDSVPKAKSKKIGKSKTSGPVVKPPIVSEPVLVPQETEVLNTNEYLGILSI